MKKILILMSVILIAAQGPLCATRTYEFEPEATLLALGCTAVMAYVHEQYKLTPSMNAFYSTVIGFGISAAAAYAAPAFICVYDHPQIRDTLVLTAGLVSGYSYFTFRPQQRAASIAKAIKKFEKDSFDTHHASQRTIKQLEKRSKQITYQQQELQKIENYPYLDRGSLLKQKTFLSEHLEQIPGLISKIQETIENKK